MLVWQHHHLLARLSIKYVIARYIAIKFRSSRVAARCHEFVDKHLRVSRLRKRPFAKRHFDNSTKILVIKIHSTVYRYLDSGLSVMCILHFITSFRCRLRRDLRSLSMRLSTSDYLDSSAGLKNPQIYCIFNILIFTNCLC